MAVLTRAYQGQDHHRGDARRRGGVLIATGLCILGDVALSRYVSFFGNANKT